MTATPARPQRSVPPFGSRVRAGDVEGVWERAAEGSVYGGFVVSLAYRSVGVPRGMEQYLVLVEAVRPAWTEQPGALGMAPDGQVWRRSLGMAEGWRCLSEFDKPGDCWHDWSEVPQPLRELVVREEHEHSDACACLDDDTPAPDDEPWQWGVRWAYDDRETWGLTESEARTEAARSGFRKLLRRRGLTGTVEVVTDGD